VALPPPLLRTANGDYWITHLPMSGTALSFSNEAHARQFVQPLMADPFNRQALQQAYANVYGGHHGFNETAIATALLNKKLSCCAAIGGGLRGAPAAKPQIVPIKPAAVPKSRPKAATQTEQALKYKVQLEIAGHNTAPNLAGELAISPASAPKQRQTLPTSNKSKDQHRVEWLINGVENVQHNLWHIIYMQGSSPMYLRLGDQFDPVVDTVQSARWPTVLVPMQLLRFTDPPHPTRENAGMLSGGWVYIFINGFLFRELQVINENGAMSDVDLGARDGVGDKRNARGHHLDQVVVPHVLNGQPQTIEIAYTRLPFTWETLGKLGGVAPNDDRFLKKDTHSAQNIARDDALCKQWLQKVDLTGYGAGFESTNNPSSNNNVGPIATALPTVKRFDPLRQPRSQPLPVVYLHQTPVKKRVIPVIYVPGIFGSRLARPGNHAKANYVWDPDAKGPITKTYAKSIWSGFFQRNWDDDEINKKVDRLHDSNARVMNDYDDKAKQPLMDAIKTSKHFQQEIAQASHNHQHPADQQPLLDAVYQRRAQRGWFGLLADYAPLLEAIELIEDEHFIYRCYGAGRDWRNDLALEAAELQQDIDRIRAIGDYPELGTKGVHYDAGSENPIVVTHSQGSLIARYASEVLGANNNIHGMVHLNQPTTGSPVLYRRFIFGAKQERVLAYTPTRIKSNIFAEIIGTSAYHFTRMGNLPGVYALLPTNDYEHQGGAAGATNAPWLTTEPGHLKPATINDVYDDIYLNDHVGLLCHKRYDPSHRPKPYSAREFTRVTYEDDFGDPVDHALDDVDPASLNDRANLYLPNETPWHHDNMRLRPNSSTPKHQKLSITLWYEELKKRVRLAKAFHTKLGVSHHSSTYVIRSNGLETAINVHLFINRNQVLECPFDKHKQGDGTVPLTSQEALLNHGAKPAGDIITKGNVVHAEICEHKEAIEQTQHAILEIVKPLRPSTKQRLFVI